MKRGFILSVFLSFIFFAHAQGDTTKISGDFRSVTIDEFVKRVEEKTSYRFYYDPKVFDLLVLNLEVKDQSLTAILTEAFKSSEYNFTIDGNQVFLLKGKSIKTYLPMALTGKPTPEMQNDSAIARIRANTQRAFTNKLLEVGIRTNEIKAGSAVITGVIIDRGTRQPVGQATIYSDVQGITATANERGEFSITLPKGRRTIFAKGIGKKDMIQLAMVYADGRVILEMEDLIPVLQEVIVSADRIANVNRVQMGVEKLTIKTIKQMPAVFGEADVLRAVLTLPGVKSVGEAGTGFNVRGGSTDQNLILFNDATIYNPSHFFGFFSAFNPEIIKDVELFKSSIPANYGGRLAAVLNITGRDGNKEKFAGSAGIGLLTSRVNIEGPIKKGKSSFNIGGRTTYSNWLLKLLPDTYDYKQSKASFYDINLLSNHTINDNNLLYVTGYFSKDHFNLNSDTTYGYTNRNFSVKWKHLYNKKLTGFITLGNDYYEYNNQSEANPVNAYRMNFKITQSSLKADFNHVLNTKHKLEYGLSSIYYKLHPGSFQPLGNRSLVIEKMVAEEQALESAVYVSDRFDVNRKFSINGGLRYSLFNSMAPQDVDIYAKGLPRSEANKVDSKTYKAGTIIKSYGGPEVRISVRYNITNSLALKAGYNTLRQYIHMLSNTSAISPTDIWKLSDYNIEPQIGDQASIGIYKNFRSDTVELSFEVYKKNIRNYLDYKNGAVLVLNDHIETDVFKTHGNAYGAEVMLKKRVGKLNGWVSYTYSRILLKVDDPIAGQTLNKGEFYPANYDKPNDFTLIGNYRINQRFSLSANVTYSTGRPITVPIGKFYYSGSERTLYADRNSYRIPDYFRTDFSMNIEGNHKVHQLTHNSWTVGLYNLTGRKNPYSVYYTSENGVINGYKLSIFGSIIPFINYNIRF